MGHRDPQALAVRPGVRRAGPARQSPALTPGPAPLDLNTAQSGNAAHCGGAHGVAVLRRVMRDTHPPGDLRQSKVRGSRHVSTSGSGHVGAIRFGPERWTILSENTRVRDNHNPAVPERSRRLKGLGRPSAVFAWLPRPRRATGSWSSMPSPSWPIRSVLASLPRLGWKPGVRALR